MNAPCKARMGMGMASIVMASTLGACGVEADTGPDKGVVEITNRGFTEVTVQNQGNHVTTYYGTAGICRIRIDHSNKEGYVARQGDTKVPDVNVSLLKQLEVFQHCFQERDEE